MKLYRVNLRGMTIKSSGIAYGRSYALAENSDLAYQKVRKWLDKNDIGFRKDRELESVELLADTDQYNDIGIMIFA